MIKWGALVVLLIGAYATGYHQRDVSAERAALLIETQAKQEVIVQQNKVAAYEGALTIIANNAEVQSAKDKEVRERQLDSYRDAIAKLGGLHDPGVPPSDSTPTTSASSNTAASCRDELSAEATGFLLDQANRADQVVDQYLLCQKYVEQITKEK